MGGKARIAARIVQAIIADGAPTEMWWEPFVGGGNVMEYAAPLFDRCAGSDAHPDLILMWQAAVQGWRPPEVTREMYLELRHAEPSALRGFVGFGASFGGKWFGGYGESRDRSELWQASARTLDRQAAVFQRESVGFLRAAFGTCGPPPGTVIYNDPPYQGTTKYADGLDYGLFYSLCIEWAKTCHVYVSEYGIPAGVPAIEVWAQQKTVSLKAGDNRQVATERLWRILPS